MAQPGCRVRRIWKPIQRAAPFRRMQVVKHQALIAVHRQPRVGSDLLVELARAADVLLCEAAWGGAPPPVPGIHLSGREAGEHAQQAGARRLLITHVPAWESLEGAVIGARQTYDGDVTAVESGQTYTV